MHDCLHGRQENRYAPRPPDWDPVLTRVRCRSLLFLRSVWDWWSLTLNNRCSIRKEYHQIKSLLDLLQSSRHDWWSIWQIRFDNGSSLPPQNCKSLEEKKTRRRSHDPVLPRSQIQTRQRFLKPYGYHRIQDSWHPLYDRGVHAFSKHRRRWKNSFSLSHLRYIETSS